MSLTAGSVPASKPIWPRLLVAIAAVVVIALALSALAAILASAAPPPPPPVRSPFGVGVREATPAASGFSGLILAWQAQFYKSLTGALAALKSGEGALALIGLSFAYGIFHAAGPGHGKGVISAYLVAGTAQVRRGFALSLAAALLQAIVAIAIVGLFAIALNATAARMSEATRWIELVSFAAVALVGLVLVWRKSGTLVHAVQGWWSHQVHGPVHGPSCADDCGHVHLPGPQEIDRIRSWREAAGIVVAAGLRPCSGAIVVLVFALSQGLYWAGIAATFAMALGTALTTGALAMLAVLAKHLALRLAGGHGQTGLIATRALEVLAAAFVLVLGATLLFGLWNSAGS